MQPDRLASPHWGREKRLDCCLSRISEELRIGLTSDCHCRRQLSNAYSRSCTERLDRHSKHSLLLPCATGNYNSMSSNLRCTYYVWNSSVLARAMCCWQPNTGQGAHCRCPLLF